MSASPPDDWDDERRTRRAGSRYDDHRDDYDDFHGDREAVARGKVAAPAVSLIIASLVALLVCLAVIVGIVCLFVFAPPPPPPPNGPPVEFLVGIYAVGGLLGVVYSVVMLLAAVRMKQLRSYGFAFAGAIMAIASFFCMSIVGILIMPFGIWALVVLCNADVKREFGRPKRPAIDHDDGY